MDRLLIENRRLDLNSVSLGKQQEIFFKIIKFYFQRKSGSQLFVIVFLCWTYVSPSGFGLKDTLLFICKGTL